MSTKTYLRLSLKRLYASIRKIAMSHIRYDSLKKSYLIKFKCMMHHKIKDNFNIHIYPI